MGLLTSKEIPNEATPCIESQSLSNGIGFYNFLILAISGTPVDIMKTLKQLGILYPKLGGSTTPTMDHKTAKL